MKTSSYFAYIANFEIVCGGKYIGFVGAEATLLLRALYRQNNWTRFMNEFCVWLFFSFCYYFYLVCCVRNRLWPRLVLAEIEYF